MPSVAAPCCSTLALTTHARQRAQQRAIPIDVLDTLLDYGVRVPAGGGAEMAHLTGHTRRKCADALGPAAWRDCSRKLASAYAVIGADGAVITVGYRFRRVGRR